MESSVISANFMPRRHILREARGARIEFASAGAAADLKACGFGTYDDFVTCRMGEQVHASSLTTTRRLSLGGPLNGTVHYLKCYRFESRPWRVRLGRAKPAIEAANDAILRRIGVAVPDVMAFGSRRRHGVLVDGFILTASVPKVVHLEDYFRSHRPECRSTRFEPRCRRVMLDLAATVARMHAAGFFHIDLQWRNIVLSEVNPERPEVYLMDSVRGGIRRWSLMRRHGMIRDLAGLHKDARQFLSATDQLFWLRSYFGVSRLTESHHALIRTILRDREIKSPRNDG
ncbi:hypothetical protein B7486_17045 [cyanobacterium TDX16]|nr:hypothetical protein B7486_17045 [cyanobacterium TDX16]